MKTTIKVLTFVATVIVLPSMLFAQSEQGISSQDIQEQWDEFNKNRQEFGEERTRKANAYAESVEMFVIEDVKVSPDAMYKIMDDSRPPPQVVSSVYMGDKMMVQRQGYFADCITPTFGVSEHKMGGWEYIIKANVPICKTKPNDKKYTPSYVNGTNQSGATQIEPVSVKKNKKSETYKVCQSGLGISWACKKDATEDEINMGPAFVSVEGGLQKTIEYAGKSGNQIKFIYSEFIDGMARDAFTREFTVDLNDGNVAAYKGAVFEIIEANNAQITYKVVRHFQ